MGSTNTTEQPLCLWSSERSERGLSTQRQIQMERNKRERAVHFHTLGPTHLHSPPAVWPWVCDTVLRSGPLGRDVSTLVTAPMPHVRFFARSKAPSIWSGPLLSLLADTSSWEEDLTRVVFSSVFLFTSNKGGLCACTSMVVCTG